MIRVQFCCSWFCVVTMASAVWSPVVISMEAVRLTSEMHVHSVVCPPYLGWSICYLTYDCACQGMGPYREAGMKLCVRKVQNHLWLSRLTSRDRRGRSEWPVPSHHVCQGARSLVGQEPLSLVEACPPEPQKRPSRKKLYLKDDKRASKLPCLASP